MKRPTLEKITHIGLAFVDERGTISNIFEGPIIHVAYITSKKGSVRANHYHKTLHQYIYLVSGELESYCCDVNNPEQRQKLLVKAGDLIDTPPMVAHAQKFLQDSSFIALSTKARNEGQYEEDTHAFPIIEGYINKNLKIG